MAGSIVTCPNPFCGRVFSIGVSFQNLTIVGASTNVAVTCPNCGRQFDATGGGDGTFSTIGGRIRKVASYLSSAPVDELTELRDRVASLEKAREERAAANVLADIGIAAPQGGWLSSQANRNELWMVLALLVSVLTLTITMRGQSSLSPDQVQHIIDETVSNARHAK